MSRRPTHRTALNANRIWLAFLCLSLASMVANGFAQSPQSSTPVVLDRLVAVVNNQPIFSSDLNTEMRLSILEPNSSTETPEAALQRLISRALIRQQIREEDLESVRPTAEEIAKRLEAIRQELPVCIHAHCATDEGWKNFLAAHDLTQRQVDSYLRNRLEILRFIEMRFRPGISISHQEIEDYYRNTLLPQYATGESIPTLDRVASRIEEILLQQRVDALFGSWLDSLRQQGDIQVFDPSLEAAASTHASGAGAQ
ncbi:MAG TPA: hypothetical protein VMU48_13790 [Terracidiphilus sp.]|nr:hypothetical protein [Terracidiphilus sp.]